MTSQPEQEHHSDGKPAPDEDANTLPQQHFANLEATEGAGAAAGSSDSPPASGADNAGSDADSNDNDAGGEPSLYDQVVGACRSVYDPEIPVNIFDLGLIYTINVRDDHSVHVEMTLTSPACPVAGTLPPEVEDRIREVEGIRDASVEVVWDPPWHPGMMTEDAALELGFM